MHQPLQACSDFQRQTPVYAARRAATAGQPPGSAGQERGSGRPTYPPARAPILPRGPSLRSPPPSPRLRDHVKEACGARDVTRPRPIGASVYVGTSDSSGLGLRSLAEVAEAGTPPGGSAGGPSVAAAPPAPPASPLGPRL